MKLLLILAYLARFCASYLLRYLNLSHLKRNGSVVPAPFKGLIDADALAKTARYTVEQSRVGLAQSIYSSLLLLGFLFTPLLPLYDNWINSLTDSFVWSGVLFVLLLTFAQDILEIPFSLYSTFHIERRYGFNTMTPPLWLTDFLKTSAISIILLVVMVSAALLLVRHSPDLWWFWVWAFFALFTITMIYLSPYIIEPLFSKFEPLGDPVLEEEIQAMLEKGGLHVKEVQKMDASKRSLHSNAYFTGIGHVKRIVLYDTLLKQMDRPEILAILAHEAGHWTKGHIWKRLVVMEAVALATFWVIHQLVSWGGIPELFGVAEASFPAQIIMISFIFSILSFPITPLNSWLSRRNEWEADEFASKLSGQPEALASALMKLTRENLSNLHPHPLFAWFYYSHPPVVTRVERLLARSKD